MSQHVLASPEIGWPYCSKCGAMAGTLAYIRPCTGIEIQLEENKSKPVLDPIGEAVRESGFDRMDRMFRNKKE